MLVPILLGVVTLVVFVAVFLARKHWHWAHLLLLVAFYFSAVGYIVLASQSLSIRTKYQEQEDKAITQTEKQTAENTALATGTKERGVMSRLSRKDVSIREEADEIGGILRLEHQVRMLNRDHGRVWRGAVPMSIDQQTGTVTVGFPIAVAAPVEDEEPTEEAVPVAGPLDLQRDAVVHIFEQGSASMNDPGAGRQYLGEFRVTEVEGRQAVLEPLGQLTLDSYAGERLLDSQGPWIVYESMPVDDLDLFARFSDEELQQLLPAESVGEYIRDGEPANADDDPYRREGLDADGLVVGTDEEAVSYRFRRLPRDYSYLFNDLSREQADLIALMQASQTDVAKLTTALASAKKLTIFREEELQKLENDLKLLQRDRQAITQHVKALQAQIAKAERLLSETLQLNASLAAKISRSQGSLQPVAAGALDVDAL